MRPRKSSVPPGFLAPPRPKPRPIEELTVRELQDMYDRNKKILSSPYVLCPPVTSKVFGLTGVPFHRSRVASSSTYVQRISAEQVAVQARLVELDGMETIQTQLKSTRIFSEEDMAVDPPYEPPISRTIEAKRKALSRFVRIVSCFFRCPMHST
jgi:hypothetical protein